MINLLVNRTEGVLLNVDNNDKIKNSLAHFIYLLAH